MMQSRVAEERGFPHYVLNYEDNFKEIRHR
jgi:hypothetical protein